MGLLARAGRNVLLGTNLAALPLARRPKELLRYASEALFHLQLRGDRGLPRKPVLELLPTDATEVRLANLGGYTWLHEETAPFAIDLLSLCLLCRAIRPRVVFEIGTFVGYTALHMALNSAEDVRVFTLDLPPDNRSTRLRTTATDHKLIDKDVGPAVFEDTEVAHRIERLYGDSATFDFTEWRDGVDLFFVDGAHSYDYVRADTRNALRCVRPGGIIVWHDYGRLEQSGVTRWLHELARDREIHAVPNGSLAYHLVR
jgi:SAM-dependent methyltransferase